MGRTNLLVPTGSNPETVLVSANMIESQPNPVANAARPVVLPQETVEEVEMLQ